MDTEEFDSMRARIDAVRWYHEFDFGDGLTTRSGSAEHTASHRRIWRFIERNLDRVDFRGKSVLDIGCWDGYWSFAAEKRGAASVLASDDLSQNWSVGQGVHLAKELLESKIDIDLGLSIYDVGNRGKKYDVILCLGVYYHLHDPYYALSQLRRCCHENTVVLLEGNVANYLPENTARVNLADQQNEFFPTEGYLRQLLAANYLKPVSADMLHPLHLDPEELAKRPPPGPRGRVSLRWKLDMIIQAIKGDPVRIAAQTAIIDPPPPKPDLDTCWRYFFHCTPFRGPNAVHVYPPPFGSEFYELPTPV